MYGDSGDRQLRIDLAGNVAGDVANRLHCLRTWAATRFFFYSRFCFLLSKLRKLSWPFMARILAA